MQRAPKSRRRTLRLRLLLLFGTLLVAVSAAEGLCRLWAPGGQLGASDLAGFLRSSEQAVGMLVVDDELGHAPDLRGPAYAADGVVAASRTSGRASADVLFLGDSVTYRDHLRVALARMLPGLELWNAGVEAFNPIQELVWYERCLHTVEARQVVLTLHNNDLQYTPLGMLSDAGFEIRSPERTASFSLDAYAQSALYRLWVNASNRWLAATPQPARLAADVREALQRLAADLQRRGVGFFVLLLPPLLPEAEWTAEEREAYRLERQMMEELAIAHLDAGDVVAQLHAAGFDVRQTPGDRWHPSQGAAQAIMHAAVSAGWFGPAPLRLNAESVVAAASQRVLQELLLDMGSEHAGQSYRILGSASGLGGSVEYGTARLPLIADAYTSRTFERSESCFVRGTGTLDSSGRARITVMGPDRELQIESAVIWHIAVVVGEAGHVRAFSNPLPVMVGAGAGDVAGR